MTKKQYRKLKTITKIIKKTKLEYIPIIYDCTYHDTNNKQRACVNCHNTKYYTDGYYLIVTDCKGNRIAYTVDNIK